MSRHAEFRPKWASSPGDTIADVMHERGLSVAQLAKQLRSTSEGVTALLEGRATITISIARRLEGAIGASVEFWMTRDLHYRENAARFQDDEEEWLAALPVGDMIKFGWIRPVPQPSEEVAACLRFFGVPDIPSWWENYGTINRMVAYRTSASFDSSPTAVAAWLRQGEIESHSIDCKAWNSDRFRRSLRLIRGLTRDKDPQRFLPKLKQYCAESGVAVSIVRAPSRCRASGATRFLTREKALLLLSFRYLTDDHFWFSFFHEAGHLLLHGEDGFFLEGIVEAREREETEANEFAARALVPAELRSAMLDLPARYRDVIRFATRAGISPGIVVGQLQFYKKIGPEELNRVKRTFAWEE